MIRNVCVYGVGGVGGYLGAQIGRRKALDEIHLTFIARGEHLKAIERDGLTLITDQGEFRVRPDWVTSDIQTAPKPDLILLCVKGYDLEDAVKDISAKLDRDTVILPVLNGIDIHERIRRVTDLGLVFPACIYVGTHITKPGTIRQSGGEARLIFGNDPDQPDRRGDEVKAFLELYGIKYRYDSDPLPAIWTKFLFIAAYGLVTAATGRTLSEVYTDEELRGDVWNIMKEIAALAEAEKVSLEDGAIENSLQKAQAFPTGTKTSIQRDIETPGKLNEKELLGGAIIRLGRKRRINTPITERYYEHIR